MSHIALVGLPEDLGNQLARVLLEESHHVSQKRFIADLRRLPIFSALFISGDNPEYRRTISLVRKKHPNVPVVVVTRQPDAWHWLDALDAGAADYCGAPFERIQLRWILESVAVQSVRGVSMPRAS